ncbi:MAG: hypothetical protein ACR5KV_00125 [Wolbachia sp.]
MEFLDFQRCIVMERVECMVLLLRKEGKIRHYVVTDSSYEMTLNWYDKNGKKYTIKIKIDKDGVDLTERNDVTAE